MPKSLAKLLQEKAPDDRTEDQVKEEVTGLETMKSMLTGEIPVDQAPNFDEAIMTHDYLTLFQNVVTDMTLKPKEPVMIGQDIIATTINMPGIYTEVKVPALGSLKAHEIGQAQEYPEERLPFTQFSTSIAIKKYGLKVSIAEEVIKQSQWPIIGMHIEAAGLALARKKEQTIFEGLETHAHEVFDNTTGFTSGTPVGSPRDESSVADTSLITHGLGATGNYNGTITLLDIMDMMGQLIANNYQPTDLIMHPLAWVILAKDPILRTYSQVSGNIGTAPWLKVGPDVQQSNMPFGLQINVSPFVTYTTSDSPHTTSIYVGSRNTTVGLIQGDGPETDQFSDPRNDTQAMKIREYYGVGLLDLGRGWTVAKGIRVAENYPEVTNTYTVS
jgi:hypothetical protein